MFGRKISIRVAVLAVALTACADSGTVETTTTTTDVESQSTTTSQPQSTTAPTEPSLAPTVNMVEGCVENYDPSVDYFPEKVTVEEAEDFEIRYELNYKVLTVRTDLVTPGMAPQVVVMVQCGTPAPDLTGELAGASLLEVPVRTFGLTRNDDLASAVALGLSDGLVTHGFSDVFPEEIDARIEAGDIVVNGGAFGAQDMDFEAVAAVDPDVMFMLLSSEANLPAIERLATLGIPAVPTLTSVSTTVLGRAEWAKVIALPFNQEARVDAVLGDVFDTYRTLSAEAMSQPEKPTAIFAQCGTNGECTVAYNSWQAEIMEHAGAVNVLADPAAPPRLEAMSIEQVFEAGADVDWWFAFSFPGEKYTGPLMSSFRSFQEGQIIGPDAEGASIRDDVREYFYSGALRPDLLLQDLVALVHPELVPDHTLTYMGVSPYPEQ